MLTVFIFYGILIMGDVSEDRRKKVRKWQQVKQWESSNLRLRYNTHSRRSCGRIITSTKVLPKNMCIFTGSQIIPRLNATSKFALPATVCRQCMMMYGKNAKEDSDKKKGDFTMNHNFNITPFVKLNLLSNGKPTFISVFDICQIYEDTSPRGEKGVRIVFKDDDYTFVEGPLDKVMYAIDEVLNPDWYKEAVEEESRRKKYKEKDAIGAARILKMYCKSQTHCARCMFFDSEGIYMCKLYRDPNWWEIPEGGEEE